MRRIMERGDRPRRAEDAHRARVQAWQDGIISRTQEMIERFRREEAEREEAGRRKKRGKTGLPPRRTSLF